MNARINLPHRHVKLAVVLSLYLSFSFLSLYSTDAFATPASPVPFTIQQPDGQQITARNRGDEWNNWVETQDGYTIAPDQNGFWYYVEGFSATTSAPDESTGDITPQQPVLTDVPATNPPPTGLPQHIHPTNQRPPMNLNIAPAIGSPLSASGSNTTGERKIVFILAEFADKQGKYKQPDWATFVTNSIGDYYSKASYGKVTITPAQEDDSALGNDAAANNGVIGWINISNKLKALETSLGKPDKTGNHPNPGNDINQYNRLIAKAAMQAADKYIHYDQYDADGDGFVTADELAVVVIVAGYERATSVATSSVYGHAGDILDKTDDGYPKLDGKSLGAPKAGVGPLGSTKGYAEFGEIQVNHQATMGVMVHELGHEIFGLPDLYEFNGGTLAPDGKENRGIGAWSVMSDDWGAKPGQYIGATPVLPDAWSKLQMGWITPVPQRDRVLLTGVGLATATSDNTVYKVSTTPNGAATEYFLIENRQNQGYDQGLQIWIPGFSGGLAIWHIDDSIDCADDQCNSLKTHPHPRVYMEAGNREWISGPSPGVLLADQKDLFYANGGWRTVLDKASVPTNSKLWNGKVKGAASGVSINSISNSLNVMRVRVPQ